MRAFRRPRVFELALTARVVLHPDRTDPHRRLLAAPWHSWSYMQLAAMIATLCVTLGELPQLETLDLCKNPSLSGTIPAGLGELPPTLTELAAAGNPFTGAENWRAAVCSRFQS